MSLEVLLDPWNQQCHRAMTTAPLFYASTELVCEYSPKSLEHRFSRQYTLGNQFDDDVRLLFFFKKKIRLCSLGLGAYVERRVSKATPPFSLSQKADNSE
jgi:hypothetical protein